MQPLLTVTGGTNPFGGDHFIIGKLKKMVRRVDRRKGFKEVIVGVYTLVSTSNLISLLSSPVGRASSASRTSAIFRIALTAAPAV